MALDPELLRCVEEDPEKPVSAVVSFERPKLPDHPRSRQQFIEERRAAFNNASADVRELISELGGAVTDEAWLSNSLRVTVPARALRVVEAAAGVRGVEMPSRLRREGGDDRSAINGEGVTRS